MGKNSKQKPASPLWTAANLLTLSRILLLPPFILCMTAGYILPGFILIVLMGVSDVLDGWTARRTNTASRFGALFDVIADCICVFSILVLFIITQGWPIYILLLSAASIGSYLISPRESDGSPVFRLGKYTGAVLMTAFTILVFCRACFPHGGKSVGTVFCPLIAAFLCLGVTENLVLKRRNKADYAERRNRVYPWFFKIQL